MLVQKLGESICRARIYLMLNDGDILAINFDSQVAPHQSFYLCKVCVQRAERPENQNHGMYFH